MRINHRAGTTVTGEGFDLIEIGCIKQYRMPQFTIFTGHDNGLACLVKLVGAKH